jgi:hypothetical protein
MAHITGRFPQLAQPPAVSTIAAGSMIDRTAGSGAETSGCGR